LLVFWGTWRRSKRAFDSGLLIGAKLLRKRLNVGSIRVHVLIPIFCFLIVAHRHCAMTVGSPEAPKILPNEGRLRAFRNAAYDVYIGSWDYQNPKYIILFGTETDRSGRWQRFCIFRCCVEAFMWPDGRTKLTSGQVHLVTRKRTHGQKSHLHILVFTKLVSLKSWYSLLSNDAIFVNNG